MENRTNLWGALGVVAAVSATLFFVRLGSARLWDRDEPRNAQCAWEMLAANDWIVPRFNGELRGHKPVLLYWLMMTAYQVFGRTEFAARFWSAVLSVGTCVLTAEMVGRAIRPVVGAWAGILLATALMFTVAARAATPDATLIFFVTAALWWFMRFVQVPCNFGSNANDGPDETSSATLEKMSKDRATCRPSRTMWTGFYTFLGLAVLAKGLVGLVLPVSIVGCFLIWSQWTWRSNQWNNRRPSWFWRGMRMFTSCVSQLRLATGLLIVILIAAPWYAWVGWRTEGRFLYEFFVEHHIHRARFVMEGHAGPIWYYFPALLVGFFPGSVFFLPTVFETWSIIRRRHSYILPVKLWATWVVVWVAAFSLAQTKLPNYITPVYPAFAALTATYFYQWVSGQSYVSRYWMPAALAVLSAVGAAIGIVGAMLIPQFLPDESILAIVGIVPLLSGILAFAGLKLLYRPMIPAVLLTGACVFCLTIFGWAVPRVDRYRQLERLLGPALTTDHRIELAVLDVLEPSWVYYTGRRIPYYSSQADRSVPSGENPINKFFQGDGKRYLITTMKTWELYRQHCSPDIQVVDTVTNFPRQEALVLLGQYHITTARSSHPPVASP